MTTLVLVAGATKKSKAVPATDCFVTSTSVDGTEEGIEAEVIDLSYTDQVHFDDLEALANQTPKPSSRDTKGLCSQGPAPIQTQIRPGLPR